MSVRCQCVRECVCPRALDLAAREDPNLLSQLHQPQKHWPPTVVPEQAGRCSVGFTPAARTWGDLPVYVEVASQSHFFSFCYETLWMRNSD